MSISKKLLALQTDHEPEGWPAVQMKEIVEVCELAEKAERERDEARALLKAHRTGDFSINGIFTSEKCPNCTGQLKDNGQRYHCHMCGREFHYGIVEEGDE